MHVSPPSSTSESPRAPEELIGLNLVNVTVIFFEVVCR
jgi:hypothetical protein